MGYDGSHAVRLGIVVGRGQNVVGTLGRACAQAGQRAPYEPKPAAGAWNPSEVLTFTTEPCTACYSLQYLRCSHHGLMGLGAKGRSSNASHAKLSVQASHHH